MGRSAGRSRDSSFLPKNAATAIAPPSTSTAINRRRRARTARTRDDTMSRTPTISIGEQSQRGAWTGQCKALPFLGKRGAKNVKILRNDGCAPPSEQLRNCLQELFAGAIHSNYSQKHYRTIAGTRVAATTIWVALLAAVRPGGYVRASNPNS